MRDPEAIAVGESVICTDGVVAVGIEPSPFRDRSEAMVVLDLSDDDEGRTRTARMTITEALKVVGLLLDGVRDAAIWPRRAED